LHYGDRKRCVLDAINALGPGHMAEQPTAPDPAFAAMVTEWQERHGVSTEAAVLGTVLAERPQPVEETRRFLAANAPDDLLAGPDGAWLAELARFIRGD
jgi:hypothetical protein